MLLPCTLFSRNAHADNVASKKVQEGIAAFHNRDFATALKTFEEAGSIAPQDLRLAFNRGCVYAVQGEAEKAIEQFQKSATSTDRKLAALSNYNLGCVAVAQAKKKFSEKPEDAEGNARTQGMERIAAAGHHFREAFLLDSQNEEARYNLEALRAWSKYIGLYWKQLDRQKQREKLNLLEYLQMLETEERTLRAKVKELQSIAQDSPRKRQSVREVENAQRELTEEIGPLEQKIEQLVMGQGRGAGQGGGTDAKVALPADAQKAVDLLKKITEQVGKLMLAAADQLAENSLAESIEPQTSAIENIDQIFSAVVPYANLVQRGITRQEELVESSKSSSIQEEEETTKHAKGDEAIRPDWTDAAWNQRFIERYGKIVPYKARQELKQLESGPVAATKPSPAESSEKKEPQSKEAENDAALKAEQQRRELKETLQLSLELAPKVEQLARESAGLLSQEKPAEALPKQQECLKLLKEMLPKQEQQEQQQKDQKKEDQDKKDQQKDQKNKDQEQKNQDKKDQQKEDGEKEKQDQKKSDQKKEDQEQKDQEKKEQEKKEQEKKEQEKKESQKDQQKERPSEGQAAKKQEMTKEQAEDLLRRARMRQEEYQEMQKEIEEYLYRPEKVEKDW